jgi:hypothetical protein
MCNVSKHYSEKKGEGHGSKDSRIDLLITWCSVRVCNLLGHNCVRVCSEGSRRLCQTQRLNRWGRGQHINFSCEFLHIFNRDIDFTDDKMLPEFHLIQILIDQAFFPDIGSPIVNILDTFNFIQKVDKLFFVHFN